MEAELCDYARCAGSKSTGIAYITFNTVESTQRCLSDKRCEYSLSKPPPPSVINWENLHVSGSGAATRTKSVFYTLVLILPVVIIYTLATAAQAHAIRACPLGADMGCKTVVSGQVVQGIFAIGVWA